MRTFILALITVLILSHCRSPHRIDYHRRQLRIGRRGMEYDILLKNYYQHYLECRHLPKDQAADSAAIMVSKCLIRKERDQCPMPVPVH